MIETLSHRKFANRQAVFSFQHSPPGVSPDDGLDQRLIGSALLLARGQEDAHALTLALYLDGDLFDQVQLTIQCQLNPQEAIKPCPTPVELGTVLINDQAIQELADNVIAIG